MNSVDDAVMEGGGRGSGIRRGSKQSVGGLERVQSGNVETVVEE